MFAALEPLPVHDSKPGKKDERERYGKGVIPYRREIGRKGLDEGDDRRGRIYQRK